MAEQANQQNPGMKPKKSRKKAWLVVGAVVFVLMCTLVLLAIMGRLPFYDTKTNRFVDPLKSTGNRPVQTIVPQDDVDNPAFGEQYGEAGEPHFVE